MNSIIDAHHHMWDLDLTPQVWLDDSMGPINRSFFHDDLDSATAGRVEKTVVVQTVSSEDETLLMLDIAAASPIVDGVVGWVDLTQPNVADRLAALKESSAGAFLRGIRHQVHDEADTDWLVRDDVRRGLAAVGAAGLVFDLLLRPQHLAVATETARALPDVSFVLDHIAKPQIAAGVLGTWAHDLAALAALPNVACKLSGLVTEADWESWTVDDLAPFAHAAIDAFGPERIMYGSDWPVCLLAASYDQMLEATEELLSRYSAHEREAMFAKTARQMYGLDTQEQLEVGE